MKTRIVFYIFSLLFFSTLAGSDVQHTDSPIGIVIKLEGTVFIRSSSGRIDTLRMNQPVYANDEVTAAGGSRTMIKFKDNTTLVIGDAGATDMKLDKFVYVDKSSDEHSPWLTLKVKGTVRSVGGEMPGTKRVTPTNLPSHTSSIRG